MSGILLRGADSMNIEIDPAEVKTHFSNGEVEKLEYRGWAFVLSRASQEAEYFRCQAKRSPEFVGDRCEARAFGAMLSVAGADYIRDRVAEMSAHQRLTYFAKTQAVS